MQINEDPISLSVVRELLDQQKSYYKDLITHQESSFKGFVQMIHDSSNKRFDDLSREMQEVKRSLEYSQKEVDELKTTLNSVTNGAIKHLQSNTETLLADNKRSLDKVEYLENQSRRNNIVIDGIPETPEESWSDSEKKFREILSGKMKIDQKHIEIERAHRIGRPLADGAGKRPRSMIVKLARYKDRQTILSKANNLKGTNIYMNEDFSDAVRQKRKDLLPEMRAARARGEWAYLKYDRLIVQPRREQQIGSN